MSIEFHDEVEKLKEIIERYSDDKVKNTNYRVRTDNNYDRYVRVVFNLSEIRPSDALEIDFENLAASIQRYLASGYYTIAYVVPDCYIDYNSFKRGQYIEKLSFVVKFYV